MSELLPSFGNYEQSFHKHSRAGFCVDVSFQLLEANSTECESWALVRVCFALREQAASQSGWPVLHPQQQ